jgi:hypothetical protein
MATFCAPNSRSMNHARAALDRAVIVQHDAAAIAKAQRLHPAGEFAGAGNVFSTGAAGSPARQDP